MVGAESGRPDQEARHFRGTTHAVATKHSALLAQELARALLLRLGAHLLDQFWGSTERSGPATGQRLTCHPSRAPCRGFRP